ncbi:MAG: NAD(P)H-dependent oxidoreductase [Myxococcales bacterium]|nr:NAD(P)H-dependent oxidoreductase [Myxococcales bacterium]
MKVAIVFNHPYEGSYCSAMLQAVTRGLVRADHQVDLIHLDRDGFNPVMTAADLAAFRAKAPVDPQVMSYRERLSSADHLVFIFPIWWELMPALTKGFIDKVIFPGVAYDYTNPQNTRMRPLWSKLSGVTVLTTMNTPRWLYSLLFGNAIKKALILGTFWKMGYRRLRWLSFNRVKQVPNAKRELWLHQVEQRFAALAT